jgi:hypothetical protein
MKSKKTLAVMGGLMLVSLLGHEAVAQAAPELRVRCEKRTNRSRISVDGNNVPAGSYVVTVTSGANKATRNETVAGGAADEFESDFDSNRNDVAEGATKISKTFIQNRQINVQITPDPGFVNLSPYTCSVRR